MSNFDEKMTDELKANREVERLRKNRGVLNRWLGNMSDDSKNAQEIINLKRSKERAKFSVISDSELKKIFEPKYNFIPNPKNAQRLKEFLQSTSARLGVWRAGVRPKTKVILDFLADHAIAKRAVYEEFLPERVKHLGFFEVFSQVNNKDDFLLRPDLGRALRPECVERLRTQIEQNPDVQIVVSDGLSGVSLNVNIEKLLPLLKHALSTKGYKVGTTIYCRYGRVGLQDRIGEVVRAKVSIILIGERPGLGTGDGLRAYLIYEPGPESTHANRNCISNIHPRGVMEQEAADLITSTVTKMFEQKTSGVTLDIG